MERLEAGEVVIGMQVSAITVHNLIIILCILLIIIQETEVTCLLSRNVVT